MDEGRALGLDGLLREVREAIAAPPRIEPARVPVAEFHWLSPCPRLFQPDPLGSYKDYDWSGLDGQASLAIDRRLGDRLAARRAVRPPVDALRVGWLFLAGPDGHGRQLFHPIVTVPVKVSRGSMLGPAHLAPAGDATMSRALPAEARRTLAEQLHLGGRRVAEAPHPQLPSELLEQLGGLRKFAIAAASALGLSVERLVPADRPADAFLASKDLVVVAGFGAFASRDEEPDPRPSPSLARWLASAERQDTALHAVLGGPAPQRAGGPPPTVESPLPLTATQRRIVQQARSARVTAVAGVTGAGKTTTATAVALDAAGRGERVLVVARTANATDALIEQLLETAPSPPVAFGSTDRRAAVLGRLVEARRAAPTADVAEAAVARQRAADELARRRESVARELRAEQAWLRRRTGSPPSERAGAAGLFSPAADLERAGQLADLLTRDPQRRRSWRRARARRQLSRLAGARGRAPADELTAAVRAAVAETGADVLEAIGGVDLESAWARLVAVDRLARRELARWQASEARHHDASGRSRLTILRTIGEVHRALRNGRTLRRLQLAQVSTVRLTTVLPVWVGSLADVDELLPARAGLFDVVVVEEATTVSSAAAAPALLRGSRAVLIGDPSTRRGDPTASVYDDAVRRAPVIELDHHFVAPPELVARPLAACAPLVHAVRPPGSAPTGALAQVGPLDGAARAAAVVDRVRSLAAARAGSVAVLAGEATRAAELEGELLTRLSVEEIDRLRLQVSTLTDPAMARADVVLAELNGPLAAGPDATSVALGVLGRTRARLIAVHDGGPWAGAFLACIEPPPAFADRTAAPPAPADAWTAAVVAVLRDAGLDPVAAWRSGGHTIDVAAVRPTGPVAIVTSIHPDGVDAHIDRHLELSRAGWRVVEVFPSRWAERLEKLPDHVDHRWRG